MAGSSAESGDDMNSVERIIHYAKTWAGVSTPGPRDEAKGALVCWGTRRDLGLGSERASSAPIPPYENQRNRFDWVDPIVFGTWTPTEEGPGSDRVGNSHEPSKSQGTEEDARHGTLICRRRYVSQAG